MNRDVCQSQQLALLTIEDDLHSRDYDLSVLCHVSVRTVIGVVGDHEVLLIV